MVVFHTPAPSAAHQLLEQGALAERKFLRLSSAQQPDQKPPLTTLPIPSAAPWTAPRAASKACSALDEDAISSAAVAELLGVPVASFWLTLDKRLLEGSWCLGTFGILRSGAVVRLLPRAAELFTPALFAAPDVRALCAAVARDAVEAALREADDRAAEAAAAELRAAMADVVDASLPRRASTASRATARRRTRGLGWTGGTRLLASERH